MPKPDPAYRQLLSNRDLERRVKEAQEHLSICDVCAWKCPVDRRAGQIGVCQTGLFARVSSFGPHLGEEKPLSGWRGSGTIFFSRCNLHCQFCQNHEISQTSTGDEVSAQELAGIMLRLQDYGCHNINLVSPSHVVPQILAGLRVAAMAGLHLPLVYNTGGYDSLEMLKLLDGVIDIYMPDMKYGDSRIARKYSKIRNYVEVNQAAVLEMHRQVGDLQINEQGLATRGLLVRHLVLPNGLAGTPEVTCFLSEKISRDTYLNLMDQYRPDYKAHQIPELNRRITSQEYHQSIQIANRAALFRLDQRYS
jgi:putative pyruvate formate lyase activating enzyme